MAAILRPVPRVRFVFPERHYAMATARRRGESRISGDDNDDDSFFCMGGCRCCDSLVVG